MNSRKILEAAIPWLTVAAIAALTFMIGFDAFAAPIAVPEGETELRVDLSEYATWAATAAFGVVMAGWGVVKGILPGPFRFWLEVSQLDQVIEAKVRTWVSKNADKLQSKASFTVDLRNEAVRDIAAMALNTGNKFVQKHRGDLVDMIHTRLEKYIRESFD
jgi:hypothetical protein